MNDIEEILEDLRKITMLTGELSKIHEDSMRKWPYILFDEVEDIEVKYDLTKQYTQEVGEGYMKFIVNMPDHVSYEDDDFEHRCNTLTNWVRDMFWPEIKVQVKTSRQEYENSSKDG